MLFQNAEKTTDPKNQTKDPISSTTTSTNSSGVYLPGKKETSSTTTSSTSSGLYFTRQKDTSSTTTSSSTSYSSNQVGQKESPLVSLSPVRPNQRMSVSSQRFSDASQNDKNRPPSPRPKIRITNYDRNIKVYNDNKIHRSASTREFKSLNQREHLKRYVVDD